MFNKKQPPVKSAVIITLYCNLDQLVELQNGKTQFLYAHVTNPKGLYVATQFNMNDFTLKEVTFDVVTVTPKNP